RPRRGHRVLARGAARPRQRDRHQLRVRSRRRGRAGATPSPPAAPRAGGMTAAASTAAVGLGGNVGDVRVALAAALAALDALPGTRLLRASRCYRTPAWGVEAQPDFVNAAATLQTALTPRALLDALLAIERD